MKTNATLAEYIFAAVIVIAAVVIVAAFYGTISYVAWHFISKFW